MEQAATLVQQAVHPDALTIFGATFDETLDDRLASLREEFLGRCGLRVQ